MKTFWTISLITLAIFLQPSMTQAADLSHLSPYNPEIHLKSEIFKFIVPSDKAVLGASTDGPVITKKLDATYSSNFRDMTIKPPKEWFVDEDYDDPSRYTYIVDENMNAQIKIERFDLGTLTLSDITSYVSVVCKKCGYEITKKGNMSVAKTKANYVEAGNGTTHLKYVVFVHDKTGYVVEMLSPEDMWQKYKSILEKSVKSIKIL